MKIHKIIKAVRMWVACFIAGAMVVSCSGSLLSNYTPVDPSFRFEQPVPSKVMTKATERTVQVIKTEKRNGKVLLIGTGSGVIISNTGLILTAAHVISEQPKHRIDIRLTNNMFFKVTKILKVDRKKDLALLYSPDLASKLVYDDVSVVDVTKGDKVMTIGAPQHQVFPFKAYGVVTGHQKGMVAHRAYMDFGSSGGPLFTLNGELAGITIIVNGVKLPNKPSILHMGYAASAESIREFLKGVKK